MQGPVLMIDGNPVITGKLPKIEEIVEVIKNA